MGILDKLFNRTEKGNKQGNSENSIAVMNSTINTIPGDNPYVNEKLNQLCNYSEEVRRNAISDLQQAGIKSVENIKDMIFLCTGRNNDITGRVGEDIVPLFYRYYPKETVELLFQALKSSDPSIRRIGEVAFRPFFLGVYKDRDPAVMQAINWIEAAKKANKEAYAKGYSCHICKRKLPKSELMKNAFGIDAYDGLKCTVCGKAVCLGCNPKNNGRCSACGGSLTAITNQ